ncbi:MAG: hypothetical protein LBR36_07225 [Bacteroidales bacterium]|jgi:hypothetical protein|nr:hypothetical protein [Bacteroidales bacterium]
MLEVALYGFSIGLIGSAKYGRKQGTDIDGCCLSAEDMKEKKIFPYYNPARGMRHPTLVRYFIPPSSGTGSSGDCGPRDDSTIGDIKGQKPTVVKCKPFSQTFYCEGKEQTLLSKTKLMKKDFKTSVLSLVF